VSEVFIVENTTPPRNCSGDALDDAFSTGERRRAYLELLPRTETPFLRSDVSDRWRVL